MGQNSDGSMEWAGTNDSKSVIGVVAISADSRTVTASRRSSNSLAASARCSACCDDRNRQRR